MLTKIGKGFVFIGDLLPIFIIGFLFSLQPFLYWEVIIFLIVILFSIFGVWYLKYKIKQSSKYNRDLSFDTKTTNHHKVEKIEDRGSIYTTYMVTMVSIIPLLSHAVYGFVAFVLIIIIVYSLYSSSDMLFYNPILALLCGYKFYRIELENEDETYAISPLTLKKENFSDDDLKLYHVLDYFYYIIK